MSTLIQIHTLRSFPPNAMNRDRNGMPKSTIMGGYSRARISSQSLKRAIRVDPAFSEDVDERLGVRTRMLPLLVEEELKKLTSDEEAIKAITARISTIGAEAKEKKDKAEAEAAEETEDAEEIENAPVDAANSTRQLIFLAKNEPGDIAKFLLDFYQSVGQAKWLGMDMAAILKKMPKGLPDSADIALFGRMTTSEAFLDIDAAASVAHAISTHQIASEYDFYVAEDQLAGGFAMLGDTGFNAPCYYSYAAVSLDQLANNLDGDPDFARQVAEAFIAAFSRATPSGKSHGFAAFAPADFVLVEVLKSSPVSYANAFQRPVRAQGGESHLEASVQALSAHVEDLTTIYSLKSERAWIATRAAASDDVKVAGAARKKSLDEMMTWLKEQIGG